MKNWLHQLVAPFRGPAVSVAASPRTHRLVAGPRGSVPPPATLAPPAAPVAPVVAGGIEVAFFAWMVERSVDLHAPLGAREHQALLQLDRLVADTDAHGTLLPRAAAVVPRLLAQLRGPASSLSELSQQVSRDVTLVAEVIRMANSATYRRQSAVVELEQAIRVLGIDGLRFAIARAVLKPLMDGRGGELSTRAARRLWQHTDCKAQLAAALARSAGLDAFDGYLLALVHNAVWSAVLRTMDSVQPGAAPWCFSAGFVRELGTRRDRLFGVVARQWQLTDDLTRVAAEVAQHGLAAAGSSAPVRLLRVGDHLASLLCAHDGATATALAEPLLASLHAGVRQCYLALAQPPHDTTP
jgi:HD-like signal output (HDOD) protein